MLFKPTIPAKYAVPSNRILVTRIETTDLLLIERRLKNVCNVVERRVYDLIVVGQTIEPQSMQIEKHVVSDRHRMHVCVRSVPITLSRKQGSIGIFLTLFDLQVSLCMCEENPRVRSKYY